MELCKVRFDGCHYLVQPYTNASPLSALEIATSSIEELNKKGFDCEEKKDLFYNQWARLFFSFKHKGRKPIPNYYRKLYNELKSTYLRLFVEEQIKDSLIKEIMIERIFNNEELKAFYKFDDEILKPQYIDAISKFVDNEKNNLKSRKRRFKVKALNNDWNYFVTFTYDDKKHNEDSFVKALKKKLQNLHSNYGWLYMGCFERSKKDRLHFHGLLYVPDGAMKSNIRKEEYYDFVSHKKAICFINEEFELRIGRNDFKPITKLDLTFTNALDYILKYIGKSDNKIVYSRGIKDDIYCLMDYEENIICQVSECSPYFVCAESSIIKLTKKLDIDFNAI